MRFLFLLTSYISLVVSLAPRETGSVSYDGYQVFRVNTGNHLSSVLEKLSNLKFDKWEETPKNIDIVLPPDQVAAFEALGFDAQVMHKNLGDAIAVEAPSGSAKKRSVNDPSWFNNYQTYDNHVRYFMDLQAAFPKNSKLISAGKSYEGREIYGLHLWGKDGPGKPAVIYHGTVHAREWIATPVVEYITLQVLNEYRNSNGNTPYPSLGSYDFYIFPIVNPDGFLYSQKTDRLWRKNRQPGPNNSPCYGRDINRNWEYSWHAHDRGSSPNPCEDTYRGEAPLDAPETKALDTYMRKIRDRQGIKLFIDWHSYAQSLLCPFGSNETLYAPSLGQWLTGLSWTSDAIYYNGAYNTTFVYGPSGATLYSTTGSSLDHMYVVGRAEWSYTFELRDKSGGFVLSPDQIRPSAIEQWEGQKQLWALLDQVFFDGIGDV
ncbi:hypothetical protein BCR34DRAFT_596037 [Clohesyomyces aquaticus]|uniref:Peptidase M14 domain-containing protein n=1 Tax=Clohesyomyces aquaticus TaxID=1231657 RepID=A0A1Y2A8G5_9PLEO|nr:hypothetical protein BCR34DRAFT_596037 [Clohesyomyces aquaticus]